MPLIKFLILLTVLIISTDSLAKGLTVFPQNLLLPLNSSATLTAVLLPLPMGEGWGEGSTDDKLVDVVWRGTNVFGDMGSLTTTTGSYTTLITTNLPAFGTITAEYGTWTKQVQVAVGLIDIFKRVNEQADNINSFMATCTLSLHIPALSINQTQTAKLLFKQPDKLSISLYDSNNKRLQTQIFSGKYMTLIDEVGKRYKKDVTAFLQAEELPMGMFQFDMIGFLEKNTVCFNPKNTNVPLYGIDAVAKQGNGYYDRILFVIDYDKGLVKQRTVYKDNAIVSEIRITDYENVDNHWLAKKTISKTTTLGYEVVNEVSFDEVGVNKEVGDGEF